MTATDPFRVTRTGSDPWEVLADGSMTGGDVMFGEARLPARSPGPDLHVHQNEDEAAYVVAGTMTFVVGEERFEAGPGTLVWLPRGVPHTFANLSDAPAWVFGTTTPAGLEGMFAEQAEYFSSLTGPPDEARIDAIGRRWGVTRLGPPLRMDG
jgi:mannose-6-phosphate isomerase-like protein (cupin superfamily)